MYFTFNSNIFFISSNRRTYNNCFISQTNLRWKPAVPLSTILQLNHKNFKLTRFSSINSKSVSNLESISKSCETFRLKYPLCPTLWHTFHAKSWQCHVLYRIMLQFPRYIQFCYVKCLNKVQKCNSTNYTYIKGHKTIC